MEIDLDRGRPLKFLQNRFGSCPQGACFPGGSEVKASAWNAGDPGSIPGLGRYPGEGKWQPTPVLLPGESHGGRSLVGYSPWGRKQSDTTERLHFTLHFHALEKEMATHSSVLALRIPGTGKPGWAAVYGVAQSRTRLTRLSSSSSNSMVNRCGKQWKQ